jgi:4-amino-4-deoxy-L-arabinose transferase-like glycosyltransferase
VKDWITVLVTAVACFVLSGLCIFYLHRTAKRVRWSRSERKLVIRHPYPIVFWAKVGIVAGGAFLTLAMGILLLVFHGHHFFQPSSGNHWMFDDVQAPPN